MQHRAPSPVGREDELGVTRQFVADFDQGPAALVLEGPAGIGKSAIWAAALREAESRGTAVRACRCSESDAGWAFAGLGDLFEDLADAVLARLPPVQQQALSAAMLLSDPVETAPGSRVLGVAVLGVLRALAQEAPVLLAVDDIQWLDASTRDVLTFALRRLSDEPVRLVSTVRTEVSARAAPHVGLGLAEARVVVGPVSVGVLQQILATRLGDQLSRPILTRLHQATGGNPMMAMEMARALRHRGAGLTVDDALSVPADFGALVRHRLSGLSEPTREVLLLSAALSHPTLGLVGAAMGDAAISATCVAEAVAADVLELDGDRIRFTHPLLASVPYAELAGDERRRLHGILAATVRDAQEHARHAALASTERSSVVAAALDGAVVQAFGRGSIDAAAELAELAISRTPTHDLDGQLRRSVDAARLFFRLGDPLHARDLLAVGLDASPAGPLRVPGLLLAATIASWESGDATVAAWCDQALSEAGGDRLLLARVHATFAETCPSGAEIDLDHARRAVDLLDGLDAPPSDLLAAALTNLAVHACRIGQGLAVDVLERAVALEAEGPAVPVSERAAMGLGMYLKVVDRFDESRHWLDAVHTCCIDEGDEMALPITLGHLATLECWAGDFELALRHAEAGCEQAERMGVRAPMPTSARVLALAHLGRIEDACRHAETDLAEDDARGYLSAVALHLRGLGVAELFSGDASRAADHLLRARSISVDEVGIGEPAILRLHGDAVEALVAVGRFDEAERLCEELDTSSQRNHQPWSSAVAARCHGLLAAAVGDLAASLESLERALVDHSLVPMPFEAARTRLWLGHVLRRRGHVTDARREIEAARHVFASLGATRHEQHARADLDSLGGRRRHAELTPIEERVSALVASGQTNREVAATLFLSVRTVDSHLGRIYRKLGVRSRTELARHRSASGDAEA